MTTNAPSCPVCGAPRQKAFRPFCSKRCANIDLNRWLSGQYAIPVVEEDGGDPEADIGATSGTSRVPDPNTP